MANSTEKKIVKGLFWGLLIFMITFLKQILIVPFMLHFWGNYKYSLWLLLLSIYSFFVTFNSGHSQYLKNLINQEYHIDKKNAAHVFSSSLYITFLIFVIILFFSFILLDNNILSNLIHTKLEDVIKYKLTLSLFFLIISYSTYQSIIRILGSLYSASGNVYIQLRFEVIYSILEMAIIIICLILGFSIILVTIILFSFTTIFLLIYLYLLKARFPEFYPWWKNGNIKTGFENFKKSLVFTFNSIFEQLNLYGINILISNIIGSLLVPVLTTIRTIANTLSLGTNIILNTILPDIQKFHAKKEGDKLINAFSINWLVTGAMVNIGLIAILPFIQSIYILWTKHKIEFNPELFLLIAWSVSIINYGVGFTSYIKGINNLKNILVITIIKSLILFSIASLFLKSIGLLSIGFAVVISELVTSVFLIKYYADKELAKFSHKIPFKTQILALSTVIVTGITFLSVYLKITNIYVICLIGIFIQIIIYNQMFNNLSDDVKIKLAGFYKVTNWIQQM